MHVTYYSLYDPLIFTVRTNRKYYSLLSHVLVKLVFVSAILVFVVWLIRKLRSSWISCVISKQGMHDFCTDRTCLTLYNSLLSDISRGYDNTNKKKKKFFIFQKSSFGTRDRLLDYIRQKKLCTCALLRALLPLFIDCVASSAVHLITSTYMNLCRRAGI